MAGTENFGDLILCKGVEKENNGMCGWRSAVGRELVGDGCRLVSEVAVEVISIQRRSGRSWRVV